MEANNVLQFRSKEFEGPQLICVYWEDIISTAGWDEGEDIEPPKLKSIGWFHSSTDKVFKIGDTLGEDDKPYGITAFPVGCITAIDEISFDQQHIETA